MVNNHITNGQLFEMCPTHLVCVLEKVKGVINFNLHWWKWNFVIMPSPGIQWKRWVFCISTIAKKKCVSLLNLFSVWEIPTIQLNDVFKTEAIMNWFHNLFFRADLFVKCELNKRILSNSNKYLSKIFISSWVRQFSPSNATSTDKFEFNSIEVEFIKKKKKLARTCLAHQKRIFLQKLSFRNNL